MSVQQQSAWTGFPAPLIQDTLFSSANITDSISLSTTGPTTFLKTSAGSQIGLFGVTLVSQPTSAITPATVAGTGSGTLLTTTTFNGWTIQALVAALQSTGIISTA